MINLLLRAIAGCLCCASLSFASSNDRALPTAGDILRGLKHIEDVMLHSSGTVECDAEVKAGRLSLAEARQLSLDGVTFPKVADFAVSGKSRMALSLRDNSVAGDRVNSIYGWNPKYSFHVDKRKSDHGVLRHFSFVNASSAAQLDGMNSKDNSPIPLKVISCPWCISGYYSLPIFMGEPGAKVEFSSVEGEPTLVRMILSLPVVKSVDWFPAPMTVIADLDRTNHWAICRGEMMGKSGGVFDGVLVLHDFHFSNVVLYAEDVLNGTDVRPPRVLLRHSNPEAKINEVHLLKTIEHEAKPESYFTVKQFGFAEPKRSNDIHAIKPGNRVSSVLIASVFLLLTVGGLVAFIRRRTPKTAVNQASDQPPASEG